jgi:hypothetical protein
MHKEARRHYSELAAQQFDIYRWSTTGLSWW